MLCKLFENYLHYDALRCSCEYAKSEYLLFYICLSVRMEQIGSNWTDFHEI